MANNEVIVIHKPNRVSPRYPMVAGIVTNGAIIIIVREKKEATMARIAMMSRLSWRTRLLKLHSICFGVDKM
jgi:hypothetical protein